MLVSVIVPVYKAEKWLHCCVDSILAQTMEDFELLLIDDGSPDRSGEICDEYAAKDSRVRVFHKENGGVSSARAKGFTESLGEWIMFVDADDELSKDALEYLLAFISSDVNVVCGNIVFFDSEISSLVISEKDIVVNKISSEEYKENMFSGIGNVGLCSKLYRKEVLTKDVFNLSREICMGEDAIGSVRIAFNNDKDVVFVSKDIYFYRQHANSCIHTFKTSPQYEQMFYDNLWESVADDCKEKYIHCFLRFKIRTFDQHFGYSIDRPTWIGSDFHSNLLKEIKQYNYKGQIISRLLLVETNKSVRWVLIFIRKVLNVLIRIKNKIFSICLVL